MTNTAIDDRTSALANKINQISKKFDIAEEVSSDDVIDFVTDKVKEVSLYDSKEFSTEEIVNLANMVEDFKFIRDTLKENISNGRRVLNSVTLDLLDAEDGSRSALITAFSELNNAIANNLKIYTNSYREISTVLLNIDKIRSNDTPKQGTTNITNNVNITTPKSTAEIIASLSQHN